MDLVPSFGLAANPNLFTPGRGAIFVLLSWRTQTSVGGPTAVWIGPSAAMDQSSGCAWTSGICAPPDPVPPWISHVKFRLTRTKHEPLQHMEFVILCHSMS